MQFSLFQVSCAGCPVAVNFIYMNWCSVCINSHFQSFILGSVGDHHLGFILLGLTISEVVCYCASYSSGPVLESFCATDNFYRALRHDLLYESWAYAWREMSYLDT